MEAGRLGQRGALKSRYGQDAKGGSCDEPMRREVHPALSA